VKIKNLLGVGKEPAVKAEVETQQEPKAKDKTVKRAKKQRKSKKRF